AGLRERRLDVGWAVATVLRSRAFFAEANLGSRVLGPVEYVVGAARALELLDPAPSTPVLAEVAGNLGPNPVYPPNGRRRPAHRRGRARRPRLGGHGGRHRPPQLRVGPARRRVRGSARAGGCPRPGPAPPARGRPGGPRGVLRRLAAGRAARPGLARPAAVGP